MVNLTQSISMLNRSLTTIGTDSSTFLIESTTNNLNLVQISAGACIGFAALILATVLGNTFVLAALFLDKRLHSPSFLLIANMATADLLLGKIEKRNLFLIDDFFLQAFPFCHFLRFWKFLTIVGFLAKDFVQLGLP